MKQSVARLLSYTKQSSALLLFAFFSALFLALFQILLPILIGRAIDFMLPLEAKAFEGSVLGLVLVIVLAALSGYLLSRLVNAIGYQTVAALRKEGFAKINRLPIGSIDSAQKGDIASRLSNDCDKILNGILQGLPKIITGVITIVGTILIMLSISFFAALAVIAITPLSVLVAKKITLASHVYFKKQADAQGTVSAYANERILNMDLINACGYEKQNIEGFEMLNQNLKKHGFRAQLYGALVNPVTRFVNHGVYVAVGLIGGLMALKGSISIGQISALLSYANRYTMPFNEISGVVHQLQDAKAALDRVFSLLDAAEEEDTGYFEKGVLLGDVDFENISFSYNKKQALIENLSLSVKAGSKVAIVGKTGAGKTTLVNLLLRFYDVDAGQIKLDGIAVRDIPLKQLRESFSMVLQDSWIFSGTVFENIAFGKQTVKSDEVIRAAKAAHAHAFIMTLPKNYDTPISESAGLSKGQIQLICLARVLLQNPPILILDEATSAVDTRTEALVSRAFDEMMQGRTAFVIAHRLSTIKNADCIVVMDKGKVVEMGSHASLLAERGVYYTLYSSQFDEGR